MAATVGNILGEMKVLAAAYLGTDWQEMPNVYDLTKCDARRNAKSYGARPLAASDVGTVTNAYALNQGFELVLMDTLPRKSDSSQATAIITDLYDKHDEIFKAMVRVKMNLGTVVMIVNEPQLSEPEFINGQEFVALRQQFNVRYRQTI